MFSENRSSAAPENIWNNVGAWCGDLLDPRHAEEDEIVLPTNREHVRKRIFKPRINTNRLTFNYYTFSQAVHKLNQIQ
jgi:hypothetical protein